MNEHPLNIKYIYWLYYAIGGLYSSVNFSTQFKRLWFGGCATMLFLVVATEIAFLTTTESISIIDIAVTLYTSSGLIYPLIVLPLITYYHRCELQNLLDFIGSQCSHHDPLERPMVAGSHSAVYLVRRSSSEETLIWLVLAYSSCLAFLSITAVDVAFFCEVENPFRTARHHLLGIPYVERVPSINVYWILYGVEFVIIGYAVTTGLPEPAFITMVAIELNNIAVEYCERMQTLTEQVVSRVEENPTEWDRSLERVFEEKMVALVHEYQQLTRMIQLMKPYMRIMGQLMLLSIFLLLSGCIFTSLLTNLEFLLKVRHVMAAISASLYLYPHCKFGTTFDNMSTGITQQVYNLPWYYLSSRMRQNVHIFLSEVQTPVTFKAFRVFRMNLSMFPAVHRIAYSYVSLLLAGLYHG